jgi:hypothetical protein
LAKEIARECGAKVISFNEYLRGNRENYLQQLNYDCEMTRDVLEGLN